MHTGNANELTCWANRGRLDVQAGDSGGSCAWVDLESLEPRLLLTTTLFYEGFEGAFPGPWDVGNDAGTIDALWGDNSAKASAGSWSAFCADNGDNRREVYDDDLHTYMTWHEVSLAGYTSASLSFDYWLNSESGWDKFTVSVRDETGQWHERLALSGDQSLLGWQRSVVDLNEFVGQAGLSVRFRFDSDRSVVNGAPSGVWVDEVFLTAEEEVRLPDLYPVSFDAPDSAEAGQPISDLLSLRVGNAGRADAGPFSVGIYLSQDEVLPWSPEIPKDVLLIDGRHEISGLDRDSVMEVMLNPEMRIPDDVQPGRYWIGVLVDDLYAIEEANEQNNPWVVPIEILPPRQPDLFVSFFAAPLDAAPGEDITGALDGAFSNIGVADAGASRVGVYLSTDAVITSADTLLPGGAVGIPPIGAMSSLLMDFPPLFTTMSIPTTTAPGNYFIGVLIDDQGIVDESNETNNYKAYPIIIQNKPDLQVTAITAPSSGALGQTLEGMLTVTVANLGQADATQAFTVGAYLSTDGPISTSDTKLPGTSTVINSLAAGQSVTITLADDMKIPTSIPVGGYYYGAFVDEGDTVNEKDETNNYRSQRMTLSDDTWTIMGYFVGDGNREWQSATNLDQMELVNTAGTPVNLLALLDRHPDTGYGFWDAKIPSSGSDWTDTRWGPVVYDGIAWDGTTANFATVMQPLDPSRPELNMGDPATLVDFVRQAMAAAPAKHYAIWFYDHGNMGGFGQDESSGGDGLNLSELQSAFDDLPFVDVVLFDACLMQDIEVATELVDDVGYLMASQSERWGKPLGSNIHVDKALNWLTSHSDATPEQLADQLVLNDMHAAGGGDVSVVDMAYMSALNDAMDAFAAAALNTATSAEWLRLRKAMDTVTTFSPWKTYLDIWEYMDNVVKDTAISATIRNAAATAHDLLNPANGKVIVAQEGKGSGMSILFPSGGIPGWYNGTGFSFLDTSDKDGTRWDDFLLAIAAAHPAQVVGAVKLQLEGDWGDDLPQAWAVGSESGQQARVSSEINHPADVDFYRVTASAGDVLHAEVYGLGSFGGLEPVLTVYDSDGETVLAQQTGAGGIAVMPIPTPKPTSGYFYVAVTSAGNVDPLQPTEGETAGVYSLILTFGQPEAVNPSLVVSGAVVDFGDVAVGALGTGVVTLSNHGGSDLDITELILPEQSRFRAPYNAIQLPIRLAPGEQVELVLAVGPDRVGDLAETLRIITTDPDRPAVEIGLRALGVAPLWAGLDIGDIGLAGRALQGDGVWMIEAAGGGIGQDVDGFHYIYQPLTGDGEIIAQVRGMMEGDESVKAGVMIRETLDPSSPHATIALTPSGASFQFRQDRGGGSAEITLADIAAPYWVRLVRQGAVFTSYVSANGEDWEFAGRDTIEMAAAAYVGLAATSQAPSAASAVMDHVGVLAKGPSDLLASSLIAPATVALGQKIGDLVSLDVRNQGMGGIYKPFNVSVYLSTDPIITSSDTKLFGDDTPVFSLLPNTTVKVGFDSRLTIPKTVAPGDYYLGVLADSDDTVIEVAKFNNYVAIPIQVIKNEWTVMFFSSGDNNLEGTALGNLNQMEQVNFASADVELRVQIDRHGAYVDTRVPTSDISGGNWTDTRRGAVTYDGTKAIWSSNLTQADPVTAELNMGDDETLIDFVQWAMLAEPAERFALIMHDHGGGWQGCLDDNTSNSNLSMGELRNALDTVGHLDLLVMDMCLMQMTEVVTEMAGEVDYFLASEDVTYGQALNYEGWLPWLASHDTASPKALAQKILEHDNNPTQSIVDVSKVPSLNHWVDNFATLALTTATANDWNRLLAAVNQATYFYYDTYRDLREYMTAVAADPSITGSIRSAALLVVQAVNNAVVAANGKGEGISIYLPPSGVAIKSGYSASKLDFLDAAEANGTHWRDFLVELHSSHPTFQWAVAPIDWGIAPAEAYEVHIAPGEPVVVESVIERRGDVDFFRFTASAGDVIHAEVVGGSANAGLAPVLSIYGPDLELIQQVTGVDGVAALSLPLFGPVGGGGGDYYLAVTSAGNDDPLNPVWGDTHGAYSLRLLHGPAEDTSPRLRVTTEALDLRDIEVGALGGSVLTLTNAGATLLEITALDLPPDSPFVAMNAQIGLPIFLSPGESVDVPVAAGLAEIGPHAEMLRIHSNDPWQEVFELPLLANGVDQWQGSSIGRAIGSEYLNKGAWTVEAVGAGIGGQSDEFRYVHQILTGDGEIIARILGFENADPSAVAGVMFRETLDEGSPYVMAAVTGEGGMSFQRRFLQGEGTVEDGLGGAAAPYWVRLIRQGSTFSSYISEDGNQWELVGRDSVRMASDVYVGLAAASGVSDLAVTARVDHVELIEAGRPDLHVTAFTAPGTAAQGQNVGSALNVTIENKGTASILSTFRVGAYISDDALIDASDTRLVGDFTEVYSLLAGQKATFALGSDLKIPTGGPGAYHIGVLLDVEDVVAEADEANNYWSAPVTITDDTWTVMVFLNADDGILEGPGVIDVNEMEIPNLGGRVNVVVEFDRIGGYSNANVPATDLVGGNWADTRRGVIVHDTDPSNVTTTFNALVPLPGNSERNMGLAGTLVDFVDWTRENYPASKYALILWDHGGGWRGMSSDASSLDSAGVKDLLTIPELRTALDQIGYVDILGFDQCLMGMAEVMTETIGHAEYVVASQANEHLAGWDYDEFLDVLVTNPDATAETLAKRIVTTYDGQTLAAVDVAALGALNHALDEFASIALSSATASDWAAFQAARNAATPMSVFTPSFRDLKNFMAAVRDNLSMTVAIRSAAGTTVQMLDNVVVAKHLSTTYQQADVGGLSIYLPPSGLAIGAGYTPANLIFSDTNAADGTRWRQFLQQLPSSSGAATTTWHGPIMLDWGDTFSEAYEIEPARARHDRIDSAIEEFADVDFFRFTASAGDVLYASAVGAGPAGETDGLMPVLTLYGPDQHTILAQIIGDNGLAALPVPVPLPQDGHYYVAVTSLGNEDPRRPVSGHSVGRYSLNLSYGPPADLAPRLDLATTVDFGEIAVGALSQVVVPLANTGQTPLAITTVELPDDSPFSLSVFRHTTPILLAPGESVDLLVNVEPGETGSLSETIYIHSTDPDQPEIAVTLTGVASLATVTLTWDGADPAEWTGPHWTPGPVAPGGGEAMVVRAGTVVVSTDLTVAPGPAASLNIAAGARGGAVNIRSAGRLQITDNVTVGSGGTLNVDGRLTAGAVNVAGGLLTNSRGSTAALTVEGNVALGDGSVLAIDLLGAGTDTLVATGAVAIEPDASLDILIAGGDGREFQAGTYTVIQAAPGELTGTFANVTVLGAYVSVNGNGLTYDPDTGRVTLTVDMSLNPGDANLDAGTDVSDRIIWNVNNFTEGTTYITGDFNGDGATDVSDRIIWNRYNFTEAAPSPSLQAIATVAIASALTEDAENVPAMAAMSTMWTADATPVSLTAGASTTHVVETTRGLSEGPADDELAASALVSVQEPLINVPTMGTASSLEAQSTTAVRSVNADAPASQLVPSLDTDLVDILSEPLENQESQTLTP